MSDQLETIEQTNFNYIWGSEGTDAEEDVAIWRPESITGYHSLGDVAVPIDDKEGLLDSDDEDDYSDDDQWMTPRKHSLARATMVREHPALVKPKRFDPIWKSDEADDDVVIWKPMADGAICYGHVGTQDSRPPSTDTIRCIKTNYVTNMPFITKGMRAWTTEDSDEKDDASFWINKDTGTFFASKDEDKPSDDFDQMQSVGRSTQIMRAVSGDCAKMQIPKKQCSLEYAEQTRQQCSVLGLGQNECTVKAIKQTEKACRKQGLLGRDCNAAQIKQHRKLSNECKEYGLPNKFFPCTKSGIHQMEVTCLKHKIPITRCTGGILEYELGKNQQAAYLGLSKQQLLLLQKSEEAEQRSIQELLQEASKPRVQIQTEGEGHEIYVSGGGLLGPSFFQKYKLFIFIGVATLIVIGIVWFIK